MMPVEILDHISSWEQPLQHVRSSLLGPTPARYTCVHAPSSTELATSALLSCLSTQGTFQRTAYVDCRVCLTPAAIYDTILNAFASWQPAFDAGHAANWNNRAMTHQVDESGALLWDDPPAQNTLPSEALPGFIESITNLYDSTAASSLRILFGHAHLLAEMDDTADAALFPGVFLAALTRLAELTSRSIVPVFVSQLPWHVYRPPMARASDPVLQITMPALSKIRYVYNAPVILCSSAETLSQYCIRR